MSEPLIGSLCTGYGGLDSAVRTVYGGELAWWSDIEPGPIAVMGRHYPELPNLGDVKRVGLHYTDDEWAAIQERAAGDADDVPEPDWSGVSPVDILTAGYPCQPFSNAGKRKGVDDPRHLWPCIARAIGVLRPGIVVLENVAAHLRRGFDVVLADLAALGYDATWTVVRAADVGACHRRERLFVLAQDTDRSARDQWRPAASGQEKGGRARPDAGGRGGVPAADSEGFGRNARGAEHAGFVGRSGPADGRGDAAPNTYGERSPVRAIEPDGQELPTVERGGHHDAARWGNYAGAVARWERVLGRVAPAPTTTGRRGSRVLSAEFVEWMMGLDAGHVTETPGLSRNQMLRLLGNGVVPQQAEYVIRMLSCNA